VSDFVIYNNQLLGTSTALLECPSTCSLPLFLFVLGTCSPKYLEEIGCAPAHSRVNICLNLSILNCRKEYVAYLRSLDMIVEIVSECLNMGYDFVPALLR